MKTQYKKSGSKVLQAIKHDPQTGNSIALDYLHQALIAMVSDDASHIDDNGDVETGYDRQDEVKSAVYDYLRIREDDDDVCSSKEDYILLVDYVQRKVWDNQ